MKVGVEAQCRAKSLDEDDCSHLGRVVYMGCILSQMHGNDTLDVAQHTPHDLGLAGEQKMQGKRVTQHPLAHALLRQYVID